MSNTDLLMLSWLQIWYHDYSLQWMQYKCIWWGGRISKFLSVPLQVLWNLLRSCSQRNTQQISTLLHSMKDNWIHYIHDKNYKNSFSCNTLFGLTNVSITNFVHLQGLSHIWETWSLNWAQFKLHCFIRFHELTEFTEFNESSAPFRKKPTVWLISFFVIGMDSSEILMYFPE